MEKLRPYLEGRKPFRDIQHRLEREGDGRVFHASNSGKPIFDEQGAFRGFRGTVIDVTEHLAREAQLRHYQKMEAVGQLTGGLAHDLNNVLAIIAMNVSGLPGLDSDNPQHVKCIDMAMKGITRAADLTRKLLDFSRTEAKDTKRVSVNKFIRGMESLIAKSLTPKIALRTELAEDTWLVDIDPGNLEDAILNLALNARDAMPDGGSLIIETANKVIDEGYVYRNPGGVAGDFVMISVSDTGVGMAPEAVARAFEPFFTTKEVGKGTGLGLSMVYGFIQRSGGHAKIYSEPGVGTTVRLYLPRVSGREEEQWVASEAGETPLRGEETILVVDDESDLVAAAVSALGSLGYRTLAASGGVEALEILRREPSVDLLFSDVIMPGDMDGYKLAVKALKERPGLRVLLTSGFSRKREELTKDDDQIVSELVKSLLSKPYNIAELAAAVRRTLDATGSGPPRPDGAVSPRR